MYSSSVHTRTVSIYTTRTKIQKKSQRVSKSYRPFFCCALRASQNCGGRIRGVHAREARAKVELDRMRRSDRTSGPPRRPLDDEFEGTAPPEGRGRRASAMLRANKSTRRVMNRQKCDARSPRAPRAPLAASSGDWRPRNSLAWTPSRL